MKHYCYAALLLILPLLIYHRDYDLISETKFAYLRVRHHGVLHPFLAGGGRLGNKIFQNFVVSWLAERYNLRAHYEYAPQCASLGLQFFEAGERLQEGPEMLLTSGLLRELLQRPAGAALANTLVLSEQYYQEAWVAQRLLRAELPAQRLRVQQANPYRARYGANNDTIIHLRLGDLPYPAALEQYTAALQAVGSAGRGGRVYITSDSREHAMVKALSARLGGASEVLDLEEVRTLQCGSTCRFLVLSEGTFSWLMGALAYEAENITYATTHLRWFGTEIFPPEWKSFLV